MTIRTVGSIVRFTNLRTVSYYVITKYVNHNENDYGACCNDETFFYIPLNVLEILIKNREKDGTPISYDDLINKSGFIRYRGEKPNIELVEGEPPFNIEIFKAVKIRRMKARTVVVYE